MKTISSANISFNNKYYYQGGSLIYRTKTGEIGKGAVSDHLPREFKDFIYDIDKKLKQEPFNVSISRGEHWRDFIVQAETPYDTKTKPILVKIKSIANSFNWKDQHSNIDELVDAVYKSINDMKNILSPKNNQKLSIFDRLKNIINNIF